MFPRHISCEVLNLAKEYQDTKWPVARFEPMMLVYPNLLSLVNLMYSNLSRKLSDTYVVKAIALSNLERPCTRSVGMFIKNR